MSYIPIFLRRTSNVHCIASCADALLRIYSLTHSCVPQCTGTSELIE